MPLTVWPACLSKHNTNVKSHQINIIAVTWLIYMALMLQQTPNAEGLLCYTCSYLQSDWDDSCVWNPGIGQKTTNCTKKYCTIVRQEQIVPAGKVISFIRDCIDKPLYLNAVKTDPTFKTFYRSCTTDLCNDSDGTQSASNVDPNFGASENTIIKGKRIT